jgi:RNA polymerase sigma-70 factor, ECF subfamily
MTDPSPCPESERVAERVTFEQVFRGHYSYVHHTLRRLGVASRELDDVAQDVFITVHRILADYDGSRPMRPWLFGIAYRHALRARDRAHVRREQLDSSPEPTGEGEGSATDQGRREAREIVLAALAELDPHQRAVFVMMEIDGFSAPEISDALAISPNTVYSRLRLAREGFAKASRRLLGGAR